MNEVRCSSCGTVYSIEPSATQQSIECQVCRTPLVLPTSTTAQSPAFYPPHLASSSAATTPTAGPMPPHLAPVSTQSPPATNVATGVTPAAGPIPPHLMQGGATNTHLRNPSDEGADAPAVDSREEKKTEKYQPTSKSTTAIVVFIVSSLVALLVGMTVFVYLNKPDWFNFQRKVAVSDDHRPDTAGPTEPGEIKWSRRTVIRSDVKVGVQRVAVGPVLAKDEQNKVQTSNSSNFLHVYIRVENRGQREVKYRSWYGNTFNDEGRKVVASLSDNSGRTYQMMTFGDVARIAGHVAGATLVAKSADGERTVDDVLIFEIPERTDLSSVMYLRLELPASACGGSGSYHLEIPGDKVQAP